MFFKKKIQSRIRKKLLMYFMLTSIVSISVSMEIILEFSMPAFRADIAHEVRTALNKEFSVENAVRAESIIRESHFQTISQLRNRMILLIIVVSASIIGAFMLFIKDIVEPLDIIVDSAKRIANGDMTVNIPIVRNDEIGETAALINSMNTHYQETIIYLKKKFLIISDIVARDMSNSFVVLYEVDTANPSKDDMKKIIQILENSVRDYDEMILHINAIMDFMNSFQTYQSSSEALRNSNELIT